MKRDLVEYWAPRIGGTVAVISLVAFIIYEAGRTKHENACFEAQQEIASFERCESHDDCTPTRVDMRVVIDSERDVERYCSKDEDVHL